MSASRLFWTLELTNGKKADIISIGFYITDGKRGIPRWSVKVIYVDRLGNLV